MGITVCGFAVQEHFFLSKYLLVNMLFIIQAYLVMHVQENLFIEFSLFI